MAGDFTGYASMDDALFGYEGRWDLNVHSRYHGISVRSKNGMRSLTCIFFS